MENLKQSAFIMNKSKLEDFDTFIEQCGRICYKSEKRMTDESSRNFIKNIIRAGHESVLEHLSFSVHFVTDRGVSHEIVRHRIASYSQESTRYCNYARGCTDGCTGVKYIYTESIDGKPIPEDCQELIEDTKQVIANCYTKLINEYKLRPEQARAILPNCLKTELIMTANLREWRHFIKLRGAKDAHPQIRALVHNHLIPEIKMIRDGYFFELIFSDCI